MVYQSVGGLGIEGHGQGRFVKFGKRQQKKVDTSLVPNPIPDLYYDQSILILDADVGIVDLSPNNTVLNNITGLSTVDSPVIAGNKSFDFTGERLEAQISMSATKWTIRTWAYFLSFSSADTTVFEWNDYRYGLLFRMDSGNRLGMWVEGGYYGVDPYPWATNKWYHLEWCYDNGNHYVFVDGKLEQTFNRATDIPSSLGIGFTYHSGGGQRMNGYLQYFQVIQGVTAHTQNFDLAEVTPIEFNFKEYGLQYNPEVPPEAIGKRPVYNYNEQDYNLLSLSPLLWLDANSSSNFNIINNRVSQWLDRSGNNYHAIQDTESSRPIYTTRQDNNLPVVALNNHSLRISNLILTGNTFDVFVVASMESPTGNFSRLLSASAIGQSDWNNSSSWVMIDRYSSNPTIHAEHNSQRTAQFTVTFGKLHLIHSQLNPSNFNFNVDATLIGTTNGTGNLNTTNGVTIGGSWVGDVNQILIFNRILSASERAIVEGYLTEISKIKSNLPTNHPYKEEELKKSAGSITNIPNWQPSYSRPKARLSYAYSTLNGDLFIRGIEDVNESSSNKKSLLFNGDAQISSSIVNSYDKSLYMTNGSLEILDTANFIDWTTDDWTIECSFYQTELTSSTSNFLCLASHIEWTSGPNWTAGWRIRAYTTNKYAWQWIDIINGVTTSKTIEVNTSVTINTWNHIAITKNGQEVTIHYNGQPEVTDTLVRPSGNITKNIFIGNQIYSYNGQIARFRGYIENFIITKKAIYDKNTSYNLANLLNRK